VICILAFLVFCRLKFKLSKKLAYNQECLAAHTLHIALSPLRYSFFSARLGQDKQNGREWNGDFYVFSLLVIKLLLLVFNIWGEGGGGGGV
jgi:hypothetical protein